MKEALGGNLELLHLSVRHLLGVHNVFASGLVLDPVRGRLHKGVCVAQCALKLAEDGANVLLGNGESLQRRRAQNLLRLLVLWHSNNKKMMVSWGHG
jgi:hypothetical protein